MAKSKKVETEGIEEIIHNLEKKYGVLRATKEEQQAISTGSLLLDNATGIGGIPIGKLIEIFGNESSGKSTIALHIISAFQRETKPKKVALFDYEHSFSKTYAESIGVDTENLLIYQPDNQESGYDLLYSLVKENIISLAVIDSGTAAIPKAIIDNDISDATVGLQARINSRFYGKIKGLLDLNKCTLIVISQTRANIGGYSGEVSTGGNALKFYADMRLKVWKSIDKVNELNSATIEVVKNKVAKPFAQANINILWGKGFDFLGEIIDIACESDIIKKSGAWYEYNGERFHGMQNLRQYFIDNADIYVELKNKTKEKLCGQKEN